MGIKIYKEANPDSEFSVAGEMTNPIRHTFDGRVGGVIEARYYVRNDDSDLIYSGIEVTPVDTNPDRNIVDGTDGYSWKLKSGDTQPLDEEWEIIDEGDTIEVGNLNDVNTYLPFWVRIEVPRNAEVESFDDVVLELSFDEILV